VKHFKVSRVWKLAPPCNSRWIVQFLSHAFHRHFLRPALADLDWVSIAIASLQLVRKFFLVIPRQGYFELAVGQTILVQISQLVTEGFESRRDIDRFLAEFSDLVSQPEFKNPVVRVTDTEVTTDVSGQYQVRYLINSQLLTLFSQAPRAFVSDIPLRFLIANLKARELDPGHGDVFEGSVLDENVQLDGGFPLHLLAFHFARGDFMAVCSRVCDDCEQLFRQWALLPLRFQLACDLAPHGFFERNSPALQESLQAAKDLSMFPNRSLMIFSLIQTLLISTQQKSAFVELIAAVAGVFRSYESLSSREHFNLIFTFIHFVCCLIYDRDAAAENFLNMKLMAAKTHLMLRPLKRLELETICGPGILNDLDFFASLRTFTAETTGPFGTTYEMESDVDWHPLLPFNGLEMNYAVILKLTTANLDYLVSFPPLPDELAPVIVSSVIFAVEFHVLTSPFVNQGATQLVLRLLIDGIRIPDDEDHDNSEPIATDLEITDLSELAILLNGIPFKRFIFTQIAYAGNRPVCVIEMLGALGGLGAVVLKAMGIERPASVERPIPEVSHVHPGNDATLMRLPEFSVCPAFVYHSILPAYLREQNTPEKFATSCFVRICLHQVELGRQFRQCPVDNFVRNAFLPVVSEGFNAIASEELLSAMHEFLGRVTAKEGQEGIVELCTNIQNELDLLDLQIRKNLDIDPRKTRELLRNYWLCIWHCRRGAAGFILEDNETPFPAFIQVLLLLLAAPTIPDVPRIVRTLHNFAVPHGVWQFLRRVWLLQHFVLADFLNDVEDWEKSLDLESLLSEYGATIDDKQVLPQFRFCNLPVNFLDFLKTPWEKDIANNNEFDLAVCMLTGRMLVLPKPPVTVRQVPTLEDVLNGILNRTYSFFVVLTGPKASGVVIAGSEVEFLVETESCYADEFGDENRGFEHSAPVSLSPQRLARLEAMMLSGSWADKIPFRRDVG
jgi:hypothetical protein